MFLMFRLHDGSISKEIEELIFSKLDPSFDSINTLLNFILQDVYDINLVKKLVQEKGNINIAKI